MTIESVGRLGRLLAISVAGVLLMNAVIVSAAQDARVSAVYAGTTVQAGGVQNSRKATNPSPAPAAVAASTVGLPAAKPAPWNGSARVAPFVETVEPSSNNAPANSPIVITFSQPMIAGSVEQTFLMRPAVEGRTSWPDMFTFRFQPYLLAHGVAYEVLVGGRSVRGEHFPKKALPPAIQRGR